MMMIGGMKLRKMKKLEILDRKKRKKRKKLKNNVLRFKHLNIKNKYMGNFIKFKNI